MNDNANKTVFLSEFLYQTIDGVFMGRDKDILLRRFGLAGYDCQSLGKVGRAHKISRERVRQIEKKILNHLRAAWKTTITLPSQNLAAVKFKETLDALLMVDKDGLVNRLIDFLDDELADFNINTILLLLEAAYGLRLKYKIKKRIKEIRLKKKAQPTIDSTI